MTTILSFVRDRSVFMPETVHAMSQAFDEVCSALDLNGDNRAREIVAVRILDLARDGERNADRLRDRVLREANGDAQCPDPAKRWHGLK